MKARKLGIKFNGQTGPNNAITDVKGVEVGYSTIIKDEENNSVRTGVTIILPRGKSEFKQHNPCYGAWYSLNGNGEMTGIAWVDESGFVEGPIAITNTHSVGTVHDSIVKYYIDQKVALNWLLPIVAETYDGFLNDVNGFHVQHEHVLHAITTASSGSLKEGNVGGGTGMICHGFKGGTGTSSRVVNISNNSFTVGVLVQANYGDRDQLTIRGVSVGPKIIGNKIKKGEEKLPIGGKKESSIIVVVATDAPLLPHQVKKLVKRVPMGISRVGGYAADSSGDIFIGFSTFNDFEKKPDENNSNLMYSVKSLQNKYMNELYKATIEATEEAIINALTSAETMTGMHGNTVYVLPHDQLKELLGIETK